MTEIYDPTAPVTVADDPVGPVGRRPLHFFVLVDTSGSMYGKKIGSLNQVMKDVVPLMRKEGESNRNAEVLLRVFSFGNKTGWHVADPTPIDSFDWTDLDSGGGTPLGEALTQLAKELTPEKLGVRNLKPVILLLSDGMPTDDWRGPLEALGKTPWGKPGRTLRVAVAVGTDRVNDVLAAFTGDPEMVFEAYNHQDLFNYVKWVSTQVTQASSRMSVVENPDGSTAMGALPEPPKNTGGPVVFLDD